MAVGLSNDISPSGNGGCVTGAVWRGTAWHTVAMGIEGGSVGDYGLGPMSCARVSNCSSRMTSSTARPAAQPSGEPA